MVAAGLMNGTSDTEFAPNAPASRAMLVTMLHRMMGTPAAEKDQNFADVPQGSWYHDAVNWAAEQGITTGVSDDSFAPNDLLTREQIVVLLYRYAKTLNMDTSPAGNLSTFADAGYISGYAKDAMSWAVGIGLVTGVSDDSIAPKAQANRAQIATMVYRFVQAVNG